MKRKLFVEIKEEARQDILAASSWYREQQSGLDKKFISVVEDTLKRIVKYPEAGAKIYKSFRQAIVKKFPYIIMYQVLSDSIVIFQVFNTWQYLAKKRKIKK